jgi:regulator of protease activity HflC (stomatin/prohibitin superfamily)
MITEGRHGHPRPQAPRHHPRRAGGGHLAAAGGAGAAILLGLLLLIALNGFVIVQPNQAKVATFLGRYLGTIRRSGFHWINPLTVRRNLSLRGATDG